jgi:rhamnogalacturonan endolyase
LIWGVQGEGDIGRACAMDIDPRYPGYEMWASNGIPGLYTATKFEANDQLGPRGVPIASSHPREINFGVWWDGDLLRELLDRNYIAKWNWQDQTETRLLTADGCSSNNGTKATPCLCADILGDWREEVIWRTTDGSALRIYTTTIPTEHRIYTLMHDPQYRLSVAWQNVGYNQPPHPGFFLSEGMSDPPKPNIVLIQH